MGLGSFLKLAPMIQGEKMLRQKSTIAGIAIVSLAILSPTAGYATPSPIPSSPVLTHAQKIIVSAADVNFAAAKASAQDGFDRAAADAKAIRDQAITDAGKNKSAIKIAQKNFRDFKRIIASDYQSAIKAAKLTRLRAFAAAHVPEATK
jgi:hypothetical protein